MPRSDFGRFGAFVLLGRLHPGLHWVYAARDLARLVRRPTPGSTPASEALSEVGADSSPNLERRRSTDCADIVGGAGAPRCVVHALTTAVDSRSDGATVW